MLEYLDLIQYLVLLQQLAEVAEEVEMLEEINQILFQAGLVAVEDIPVWLQSLVEQQRLAKGLLEETLQHLCQLHVLEAAGLGLLAAIQLVY
jgi:hypothetical protein